MPCATASVGNAIGSRAVPRHAYKKRPVVTVIRRPPILRAGHQRMQVLDNRVQIQALELFRVVKPFAHRIGLGRMLVQNLQIQLIGPPVCVGRGSSRSGLQCAARKWALRCFRHDSLLELSRYTTRLSVEPSERPIKPTLAHNQQTLHCGSQTTCSGTWMLRPSKRWHLSHTFLRGKPRRQSPPPNPFRNSSLRIENYFLYEQFPVPVWFSAQLNSARRATAIVPCIPQLPRYFAQAAFF